MVYNVGTHSLLSSNWICSIIKLLPGQGLFWTYATCKWSDEGIDYYSLPQKDLDKLAESAADLFVAEKCATATK